MNASPASTAASSTDSANPYVGPRTFTYADRARFFGREREARELLSLITAERLVLFYASSGAGKSSLLHTRIIPGLAAKGFEVLPVGRVSGQFLGDAPGASPNPFVLSLALSLDQSDAQPQDLAPLPLADFLDGLVQQPNGDFAYEPPGPDEPEEAATSAPPLPPRALFIDQFEEILTTHLGDWEKRADFFGQLRQALEADPLLWVVLTMREDYVASLAPYAHLLPGGLRSRYYMQRMDYAAAREAVRGPVADTRPFAPGVAEKLVDNLRRLRETDSAASQGQSADSEFVKSEFIEPVQLQVVCHQLWEALRHSDGQQITHADLARLARSEELGLFVDRALADFYEQAIRTALAEPPQASVSPRAVRAWFSDELITDAGTRGFVYRGETHTGSLPNPLAEKLAAQFIIRAERRAGSVWYELVHDRFIEPIQKANLAWLADYQNPLAVPTQAWLESSRSRDKLLTDPVFLQEAQRHAQENPNDLRPAEQEFLERSLAEQARLAYRQQRIQRNRRLVAALALAAIFILTGLTSWALWERGNAKDAERTAAAEALRADNARDNAQAAATEANLQKGRAEQAAALARAAEATAVALEAAAQRNYRRARAVALASAAETVIERAGDPSLALLLARDAVNSTWDTDEYVTVQADAALRQAIAYAPPWRMTFPASYHIGGVFALARSPDGQLLASAGEDQVIRLWDTQTGAELAQLAGHTDTVWSLAFNRDGSRLVSASFDGSARVWDVPARVQTQIFRGHAGELWAAAFSPDGRFVISAGDDRTLRVWEAATGQELLSVLAHDERITAVAVHPQGTAILTASQDRTARIWPLDTSQPQPRLGQPIVLRGHREWVQIARFTPDGRFVVTGSHDKTFAVWDAASGELLESRSYDEGRLRALAFDPSGALLATGGDEQPISLWDVAARSKILDIAAPEKGIAALVFSADGRTLFGASPDRTVRAWDVESGQPSPFLPGHVARVNSVALQPGGTLLATGGQDSRILLWDVESGAKLAELNGHRGGVNELAFSPDGGRLVSGGSDGAVLLWEIAGGNGPVPEPTVLLQIDEIVQTVAFSPDGAQIAAGDSAGIARLLDPATGRMIFDFDHDRAWLNRLAFSASGQALITAGEDGRVCLWSAEFGERLACPQLSDDPLSAVAGAPAEDAPPNAPDRAAFAVGGLDGRIRIFSAAGGGDPRVLAPPDEADETDPDARNQINALDFSPDGRTLLAATFRPDLRFWNVESGQISGSYTGHLEQILDAEYSADGQRIASASQDWTARVWGIRPPQPFRFEGRAKLAIDATPLAALSPDGRLILLLDGDDALAAIDWQSGETLFTLPPQDQRWTGPLRFAPDGQRVIVGLAQRPAILDLTTGAILPLADVAGPVLAADFSPDGARVAVAGAGGAGVWDAQTGQRLRAFQAHREGAAVQAIAFSPDGARVASGDEDNLAFVWDAETGAVQFSLPGLRGAVQALAFSPDGSRIAVGGDDAFQSVFLRVYDARSGALLQEMTGHTGPVRSVSFSPDGRLLASGGADETVRIWRLADGRELRRLLDYDQPVVSVQFGPDGDSLLAVERSGRVRLWIVSIDELLALASSLIQRQPQVMTPQERSLYGVD